MSFGLTFDKLLLIGLLAVFLIGPDRLPMYSQKLARLIRSVRQMAKGAEGRIKDELGEDFDPEAWKKLDPRQYDPRRILRDAITDSADEPQAAPARTTPAPVVDPDQT